MQCSFPQVRYINRRTGEYVVHACGRCRACRRNKSREWQFRVFAESLSYKDSIFLCLTYDDEHLPISEKGYPTLVKEHLQDFMKRFRYYVGKCRYYACGEYGSWQNTHRPHFHLIVYGVSPDNPVFTHKYILPKNNTICATCKAWDYGDVNIGDVSIKSCHYCCEYMEKRKTGKLAKYYFDKFGILPEFGVMSLKPGIGYKYLKENETLIKKRGYCMMKGHKVPLPRYYIDKMFECDTDEYEQFKAERSKQSAERWKKFFSSRKIGDFSERAYYRSYLEQQEVNLMKGEQN